MPDGEFHQDQLTALVVKLEGLTTTVREMENRLTMRLASIERSQSEQFITRKEFEALYNPVRNVVYGLVGLLLAGIIGTALKFLTAGGKAP